MPPDSTLAGVLSDPTTGSAVADRAREAYVDGMEAAAGATVGMLVVAGLVSAYLFRRAARTTAPEPERMPTA